MMNFALRSDFSHLIELRLGLLVVAHVSVQASEVLVTDQREIKC